MKRIVIVLVLAGFVSLSALGCGDDTGKSTTKTTGPGGSSTTSSTTTK